MEPIYFEGFISKETADNLFYHLKDELAWERRPTAPRSEYWTNIFNRPYTYGSGSGQRTYEAQPTHKIIDGLNNLMFSDEYIDVPFEGCFLNWYHDGKDALGWHADDDPAIDHTRPIAVVTLGSPRRIEWKSQEKGSQPSGRILHPGSIFMMPAGMQHTHFHRIPKVDGDVGERISLTYRGLLA